MDIEVAVFAYPRGDLPRRGLQPDLRVVRVVQVARDRAGDGTGADPAGGGVGHRDLAGHRLQAQLAVDAEGLDRAGDDPGAAVAAQAEQRDPAAGDVDPGAAEQA